MNTCYLCPMLLLLWLVYGFWALRLGLMLLNLLDKPYLPAAAVPAEAPLVSVLVPARNEAHNLPKLFSGLAGLNWPKLELLLLNDHSEDATAAVATEQAQKLPAANWQSVEVLNGQPLPQGWLGKSWACHQLAAQAQGRYLLFLDADVSPEPQLVQSLFGYAQQQKLAVLSLFPQQQMLSFAERVVVPHYAPAAAGPAAPALGAATAAAQYGRCQRTMYVYREELLPTPPAAPTGEKQPGRRYCHYALHQTAAGAGGSTVRQRQHRLPDVQQLRRGRAGLYQKFACRLWRKLYRFVALLAASCCCSGSAGRAGAVASLLLLLFALVECLLMANLMQTNLLQQLLAFFPRLWALLQVGLASFAGAANKNYTWKGRTLNK